jgi:hypothetical protein
VRYETHNQAKEALQCRIEVRKTCGPFVHGRPLWILLGFGSERSYQRGIAEVLTAEAPLRPAPGRKGYYCMTSELADWLVLTGADWQGRVAKLRRYGLSTNKGRSPK